MKQLSAKYVDIPGSSLLRRRRWANQAPAHIRVTDPMDCPGCDRSISPQPIAYGYPGQEMADAAERGEIFLGGCVVYGDFPSHRCPMCGVGLGRLAG